MCIKLFTGTNADHFSQVSAVQDTHPCRFNETFYFTYNAWYFTHLILILTHIILLIVYTSTPIRILFVLIINFLIVKRYVFVFTPFVFAAYNNKYDFHYNDGAHFIIVQMSLDDSHRLTIRSRRKPPTIHRPVVTSNPSISRLPRRPPVTVPVSGRPQKAVT